ncbi:LysR family transcriptional regulator [Paracoccus stylophorae]|uniref:LysR family transcriptional regulator n=1 Tax=Paracoccus stylophorae TaxID=659350 RepID=A0ABY7SS38_9RHOB|nr:LysR family transcriptional regulator [Paracoccus stylophorae]WCR09842.1 LysR family transcriptional regulator [Paracoccus stylophorae]
MDARIDDWNDLRLFLAVARAGTLSGAAREIGVNHSTVFRRIGAFEEALGVRLFDRLPNGYALTVAGEAMQESALRVEEEIAALDRRITGQDLRLSGVVRITTVDMLAQGLLPRHLLAFRRAYPGIEIELTVGNATLPCAVADLDPNLTRVAPLPESFTIDMWLLTHEDLRRTARIRVFMDFMAEALAREAPLLEGRQEKAADAETGTGVSLS